MDVTLPSRERLLYEAKRAFRDIELATMHIMKIKPQTPEERHAIGFVMQALTSTLSYCHEQYAELSVAISEIEKLQARLQRENPCCSCCKCKAEGAKAGTKRYIVEIKEEI